MRLANSSMLTSSVDPILKILPGAVGQSAKRVSASIVSLTEQKQRDWCPSPNTRIGSFVLAASIKRGSTMP